MIYAFLTVSRDSRLPMLPITYDNGTLVILGLYLTHWLGLKLERINVFYILDDWWLWKNLWFEFMYDLLIPSYNSGTTRPFWWNFVCVSYSHRGWQKCNKKNSQIFFEWKATKGSRSASVCKWNKCEELEFGFSRI